MEELILCTDSERFVQALAAGEIHDVSWFDGKTFWEPRGPAETNDKIVQLIPYQTIEQPKTISANIQGFLSYRRSKMSGEMALIGKKSIGFGGHISLADEGCNTLETVYNSAARELDEELGVEWDSHFLPEVRGVIWTPDSPKGQFHIGIHLWMDNWSLAADPTMSPGPEVTELEWMPREKLLQLPDLEAWSEYVLRR